MKIKSSLALGAVALAAPLLTSCLGDGDDNREQTLVYNIVNLVTPSDADVKPYMSTGTYSFYLKGSNLTVSTADLMLGTSKSSFVTGETPYTQTVSALGTVISFNGCSGNVNQDSSLPLNNFSGRITSAVYYISTVVPGITGIATPTPIPVLKYNIGNEYTVRTFCRDAYYAGTTTTHYTDKDGNAGSFENKEIVYRAVINVEKMTADVVIYNAQFAPQQPQKITAMVLKALPVETMANGYRITGEDIIPEVVEGAATTPNPNYPFKKFSMTTTSDNLDQVAMEFNVGDRYHGMFSGVYCLF